ncbi:YIP1 family protein [Parasalinivibrio latis]|uniref:YIP1 family protein n=1 Tax=Parasalinivibrio latis TaxID=2952610 RepID=UPI0030E342D8
MIHPSSNPFYAMRDSVTAPVSCFAALYERPVWGWVPYLLLIASGMLFWGAYFDHVNFNALARALSTSLSLTPEQQSAWMQKEILLAGEVMADVVGRTGSIIMMALWLHLSSKSLGNSPMFRQWLGASCFIFLPAIIGDLASYANLLFNQSLLLPAYADLNSLNAFFKVEYSSPWSTYLNTFPILLPWYFVNTLNLLTSWVPMEKGKAITIASLPWLLVFVGWGMFIAVA